MGACSASQPQAYGTKPAPSTTARLAPPPNRMPLIMAEGRAMSTVNALTVTLLRSPRSILKSIRTANLILSN